MWEGKASIGVCNYLINSANNPHVKFAMFDSLDVKEAEASLKLLCATHKKEAVHFKTYSFFPNENPTISIDIATSSPLIELQAIIHDSFKKFGKEDGRRYFDNGIWTPNCQLTIGIDKIKLGTAVSYLCEMRLPFDGVLERIGIIEFHPAKQLCSYML